MNELKELSLYKVLDKYLAGQKFDIKGKERLYCCPFHEEKTPSFSANDELFHCFGCGASGNAISFVAKKEGIDTKEAYKKACDLHGYFLEGVSSAKGVAPKPSSQLEGLLQLYTVPMLAPNAYLKKRGITTMPAGVRVLTQDVKITEKVSKEPRVLNLYKGTIIAPLYNANGRVQTVQHISNNGKFFLPNWMSGVGGVKGGALFLEVPKAKHTFFVEALIDGLSLNQAGFNAVVCFTADNLPEVALVHKKWQENAYIYADDDAAGLKGASQAARFLGTAYTKPVQNSKLDIKLKDANDVLVHLGVKTLKANIETFLGSSLRVLLGRLCKTGDLIITYLFKEKCFKIFFQGTSFEVTDKLQAGASLYEKLRENGLLPFLDNEKQEVRIVRSIADYVFNQRKSYHRLTYEPKYGFLAPIKKCEEEYLNIYRPSGLHARKDLEEKPFDRIRQLLLNLTDNDKDGVEWFLDFLAFKWQKPWIKNKIVVVFHGAEGTGKTPVGNIIGRLFGSNANTKLDNATLESNFNSVIKNRLFLVYEEVSEGTTTRQDIMAKIKTISGADTFTLNEKHKQEISDYPNYGSIIMLSNEDNVAKPSQDDTRYVVFYSKIRAEKAFFLDLFKPENFEQELEGLAYHLSKRQIPEVLKLYENESKARLQELSKNVVHELVDQLAESPDVVIKEVADAKNLPLVYENRGYMHNLVDETEVVIYYLEKEDGHIFMSAQQFLTLARHRLKYSKTRAASIYSMARESKYWVANSVRHWYGKQRLRLIKIKENKEPMDQIEPSL